MLKQTITFPDYNGNERTESFYFNLSKAEVMEMEMSTTGGYVDMVERIVAAQDSPTLVKIFKDLVFKAYGEKSPDGRRFIKSEELSTAFSQTEAYSQLFMELATDAEAASKFVNGIIPQSDEEKPVVAATLKPTVEELAHENKLLKVQLQAQSDRSDFMEDCIAEMASQVYSTV